MPTATRSYRGQTSTERAAVRRRKLLDAGLELFGTRGVASTRVDDVCAEAGLTKRYFYESFASLEELFAAVLDDVVQRLVGAMVPAISEGGWRNPRAPMAVFVGEFTADPRLIHLFFNETHQSPSGSRRQDLIEMAVDIWLDVDPATDRSPEHLATQRLLAHAMGGATGEVLLAWAKGRITLTSTEVIDHLVRIFDRITPRPAAD